MERNQASFSSFTMSRPISEVLLQPPLTHPPLPNPANLTHRSTCCSRKSVSGALAMCCPLDHQSQLFSHFAYKGQDQAFFRTKNVNLYRSRSCGICFSLVMERCAPVPSDYLTDWAIGSVRSLVFANKSNYAENQDGVAKILRTVGHRFTFAGTTATRPAHFDDDIILLVKLFMARL